VRERERKCRSIKRADRISVKRQRQHHCGRHNGLCPAHRIVMDAAPATSKQMQRQRRRRQGTQSSRSQSNANWLETGRLIGSSVAESQSRARASPSTLDVYRPTIMTCKCPPALRASHPSMKGVAKSIPPPAPCPGDDSIALVPLWPLPCASPSVRASHVMPGAPNCAALPRRRRSSAGESDSSPTPPQLSSCIPAGGTTMAKRTAARSVRHHSPPGAA